MTKTKMKTQNLTNPTKNKKFSLKIFNKILLLLIIVSGVYYITCINDLSIKSFRMQELKDQINYLDNKHSEFEAKIMFLNSYNNLSQKVETLNMVAIGEIDYIAGTGVVAVQK